MLKTTKSAENLFLSKTEDAKVSSIGVDSKNVMVKRSPLTSKNLNGAIGYLTPNVKQGFTQLRQAFIKASIFQHFDPECYIQIEIDASSYAVDRVLSQLTLDNLGRWHPVVFYS